MLIAFLIMLREGIEAALIVGIVASFLKQSGHSELMPKVWLGVFLAAAICFGYWLRHSFRYRRDSAKRTGIGGRRHRPGGRGHADVHDFVDEKGRTFDETASSGFCSVGLEPRQRPWVGPWSAWRFWLWRVKGWRACFSCWPCSSKARHGLCR